MKIVIVGNGIAGNQVAFELRRQAREADILILSAEAYPQYDPCSLPYYLSGQLKHAAVFKRSLADYEKNGIELIVGHKAVSVDPDNKCVTTHQDHIFSYDKLVLAHGGDLFVPPIDGVETPGVFSLKQLADTENLDRHNGQRAVVIGSGAIGIEAAEALKKRGYEVSIVELFEWILPALFDRETGERLEADLKACDIQVYTNEKVAAIHGESSVESVETDRRTIPCDTVVLATGVVPGMALPLTAGIQVERGIKVNEKMETSVENIYACGDCVETVDVCTGEDAMFQLKHNAIDQANVVAANILGQRKAYPGAYAFARVHFFDTHASCFGKTTAATQCELGELEIIEKSVSDGYLRIIVKEDIIVGIQAVGALANAMGFFIRSARRQDNFNRIRKNWPAVKDPTSYYPWTDRMIGSILAL
jgi:NADH oxidase (H2O2-forming)